MGEHTGLPTAHPSLPKPPGITTSTPAPYCPPMQQQQSPAYAQVRYQYTQSSHYAQAYLQAAQQQPVASMSSWQMHANNTYPPLPTPRARPGDVRCTYKSCTFFGPSSALEVHKMDRHLIFPPGYDHKPTWDADPSLKGKPIPIQGTMIILDSPDVLDAWIAERKKRWPSASLVEDKKRKMDQALARGQMTAEDLGLGKRRRIEPVEHDFSQRERGRGRGARGRADESRRGRGRGKGAELIASTRGTDVGWGGRGRGRGRGGLTGAPMRTVVPDDPSDTNSSSDGEDSDSPPEVVSSKRPAEAEALAPPPVAAPVPTPKRFQKPTAQQPKPPPRNPFASRPTLLRNLLLPEIRMTVSNLSQAIRFLVDNDFLEGVELKPGDTDAKMIQVIELPPELPPP